MKALIVGVLLIAASAFAAGLHAEVLRCDGDLAQVGDTKASVLQKCGSPYFTESFCNPAALVVVTTDGVSPPVAAPCVVVDEWSYNPGPGQFITTMRFESGVVTSIRFGARVR